MSAESRSFTKRQAVLVNRIQQLCDMAAIPERFPINITMIRGGGSLFRLEPNPKDVDLAITFTPLETRASTSFNKTFAKLMAFAAERADGETPAETWDAFVARCSSRYSSTYRRWLEGSTWSAIYRTLEHIDLHLDGAGDWFGKPICHALAHLFTRRMVRGTLPGVQIAELDPCSDTCMKMHLSVLWTPERPFDPNLILDSAVQHRAADEASLVPDYWRVKRAAVLYRSAISTALKLRARNCNAWPAEVKSLSDEAYQALHGNKPCRCDATPDIRVLRKQLKHLRTVVDCQESLLYEIVHYKTSPYCRRWGLNDEPRSLEQYLATALFGQASKQRTRSWLPIVLEHGLNLAALVHAEQIRLKRRSEVSPKLLESMLRPPVRASRA